LVWGWECYTIDHIANTTGWIISRLQLLEFLLSSWDIQAITHAQCSDSRHLKKVWDGLRQEMCQRFRDAQTWVDVFLMPVGVKAVRQTDDLAVESNSVTTALFPLLAWHHVLFFIVLPLDETALGAAAWTGSIAHRQDIRWWVDVNRSTGAKHLSRCQFIDHESHIDCTGMEPRPPV